MLIDNLSLASVQRNRTPHVQGRRGQNAQFVACSWCVVTIPLGYGNYRTTEALGIRLGVTTGVNLYSHNLAGSAAVAAMMSIAWRSGELH
jgi:hypothetical protein